MSCAKNKVKKLLTGSAATTFAAAQAAATGEAVSADERTAQPDQSRVATTAHQPQFIRRRG